MIVKKININIARVKSTNGEKWFQLDISKNEKNDHGLEQRIILSYNDLGALIGGDSDLIVTTEIYQ